MTTNIDQHTYDLFKRIFSCLKPPDNISVSEWADRYRRLPAESSAEPGMWKTDRTPYLRKIMDSISDPSVRKVAIMSSSQVGKSEVLINTTGYYSHNDPSPMLMVQPTVDAGQDFSKERIAPSIRDTPVLHSLFGEDKSRNSRNTILKKFFPGGYIAIVGANSPAGLAARPVKVLLADEIDRWPESAKQEGDPLTLAENRTTTFPYSQKLVYTSTPTIDGFSRIQHEYLLGSMEEWRLPCPKCGTYQLIKWADITYSKTESGVLDENIEILCKCNSCEYASSELQWKAGAGQWYMNAENAEIKSFHLSALVSPWKSWKSIVKDFLSAQDDPEMMKVWTNTVLGEPWIQGETVQAQELENRRKPYYSKIPADVLVLTMGVDIQDDRFEYEIAGWGDKKRSWGIEYGVIYGSTALPETWDRLEQYINKTFLTEDGITLGIARVCIDSGGHRTTECYKFCAKHEARGVFAIKGKGGEGFGIVHSYTRTKKVKNVLFIIAVDTVKSLLYTWLQLNDEQKAGYCSFPSEPDAGYGEKYFQGLTSEVQVIKMVKGRPRTEWKVKPGVRNEPLDCRAYNIAAIEILNPNFEELNKRRGGKPERNIRRRGRASKGVELD